MTTPTPAAADQPDTRRWGRIPAWWLDHPDLDADGLAVLAALATFADEHGVCWPSQSTLAAKLKRSRPTINRILQRLDDAGLVAIEHRRGRDGARLSCLYRLRLDRDGSAAEPAVRSIDRDDSQADVPCPAPSHKQLHFKQNPDSRPERGCEPASEVAADWMPNANDMAWAKARFGEVDLGRHVEGFILRCQAHGYRYRDIGAAWRAWLSQDAAAGKAPLSGTSSRPQSRSREKAAEQSVGAWASAAAELRQRDATQPWS